MVVSSILKVQEPQSWCPRAGEGGWASSEKESLLFLPFYSIWAKHHLGWCLLSHCSKMISLSPLTESPISSRNNLTNMPRNNVLPAIWATLSPVKWHTKLTITAASQMDRWRPKHLMNTKNGLHTGGRKMVFSVSCTARVSPGVGVRLKFQLFNLYSILLESYLNSLLSVYPYQECDSRYCQGY
jgi:hypothetical protein